MFNKYKRQNINNNKIEYVVGVNQTEKSLAEDLDEDVLIMQKPSIISSGAIFDGDFTFNGILHLDGQFKGNLKVNKIIIGKNGVFNGKLSADVVIVMGNLNGEVKCSELALNAYSNVTAKISYDSIRIQPNSSIAGELICSQKFDL